MTNSVTKRKGVGAWFADVMMGFRFAVAGGRAGWVRAGLTAFGIALAVGVLLVAASIPSVAAAQQQRQNAVSMVYSESESAKGDGLLVEERHSQFRELFIRGQAMQPMGDAPMPPGIKKLPEPGEIYLSPALAALLESDEGELLRPRFDHEVAGIIGEPGLVGPGELQYYLGSDELNPDFAELVTGYGVEDQPDEPIPPILVMLVLVAVTIMLLPVVMFMAVAVRFGGESRDRRLAALRLVGADQAMTRRVAAGESLLGALVGLALGWVLFEVGARLLVGAGFLEYITSDEISVFAQDIDPDPVFAGIVVLAVPLVSVFATQLSMRRLAVEPLGVVRNAKPARRRLWWRLLLAVVGVACLSPAMLASSFLHDDLGRSMVVFGVLTLLLGLAAMLPWLVETLVARSRGGTPSWQLATRRLQLGGGSAFRAVIGVAVAAAGAIALQMMVSAVETDELSYTGHSDNQTQITAPARHSDYREMAKTLDAIEGTEVDWAYSTLWVGTEDDQFSLVIADCADLAEIAKIDECAAGDVFGVTDADGVPKPGTKVEVWSEMEESAGMTEWTVPKPGEKVTLNPDDEGMYEMHGLLMTPEAMDESVRELASSNVMVETDAGNPDAVEQVRNVAATNTPEWEAASYNSVEVSSTYAKLRSALLAGVVATMLLIGLSLLVNTIEQLQERRRLMSVLVAFGTRRRSLVFSVLWQTAIPVAIGLAIATVTGLGLGTILVQITSNGIIFDWSSVLSFNAAGAGMVLVVTLLSLPPLWRMMRPDGIRTE